MLFPFRDTFMQSLNLKKIPFRAIVYKRNLYDYLRSQVSSEIDLVEDFSSFSDFRGYKNIVFVGNACILPAHLLEKLFFSISRNSDSGTKIFFRFANSSITFHNPFQENYLTRISVDLLTHFLREEGFKNIVRHTVEEGELSLFTFQKP